MVDCDTGVAAVHVVVRHDAGAAAHDDDVVVLDVLDADPVGDLGVVLVDALISETAFLVGAAVVVAVVVAKAIHNRTVPGYESVVDDVVVAVVVVFELDQPGLVDVLAEVVAAAANPLQ